MAVINLEASGQTTDLQGNTVEIPPQHALQEGGPVLQVSVGLERIFVEELMLAGSAVPSPLSGAALIDTGAIVTCINNSAATLLGLPAIDVVTMMSASNTTEQNIYPIQIEIVGTDLRFNVQRAMGAELATQGYTVLIGRDALASCTLHYNGLTGNFTLAA